MDLIDKFLIRTLGLKNKLYNSSMPEIENTRIDERRAIKWDFGLLACYILATTYSLVYVKPEPPRILAPIIFILGNISGLVGAIRIGRYRLIRDYINEKLMRNKESQYNLIREIFLD